jgi:hypothetical protein
VAVQILEVTLVGQLAGQQCLNRFHFVNPAGTGDPTDVLAPFVTDVVTPLASGATAEATWDELLYRVITDATTPGNAYSITPAAVGAEAGDAALSFASVTVRWNIGATAIILAETPQRRIHRGGKHIGGLIEGYIVDQHITPACHTWAANVAEGYLGMSDGGWIPCVVGFEKIPVPRPHPLPPEYTVPNKYALITGYLINPNLGSQVSRKVGHGA